MKKRILLSATIAITAFFMLAVASCGPAEAPSDTNAEKQDTSTTTGYEWDTQSDCGTCHQQEQASQEDTSCLVSQHKEVTCITCHVDNQDLTDAHQNATAGEVTAKRLKKTSVEDATCSPCHGSYEELASTTSASTSLTDLKDLTINPHEVTSTYNKNGAHDIITCSSCHVMHEKSAPAEKAQATCKSCHHEDVYECYTCHE